MRKNERGNTAIEMILSLSLAAIIALGGLVVVYQTLNVSRQSSDILAATANLESAGFWLNRDAQMAEGFTTESLNGTDIVIITWEEFVYGEDTIDHSVTYSIQDLNDSVGKLDRFHWSSAGTAQHTTVAGNVYYAPSDLQNSTRASYADSVLSVKIAVDRDDTIESRSYTVVGRTNFFY